jgi:predicted RecB family nuclease
MPPLLITDDIFGAFLRCETKAYLLHGSIIGDPSAFTTWQHRSLETYRQQCSRHLRAQCSNDDCLLSTSSLQQLKKHPYQFVFDCLVQVHNLEVRLHALERLPDQDKTHYPYIPIRFVPNEKVTKYDKLLLAFDALALELASGKRLRYGKIIYGRNHKPMKIRLPALMKGVRSTIDRITTQVAKQAPPELVLNKHCPECTFRNRCRQQAIERDDLSLLTGMSVVERKRYHNRGIFSVTQLSYTFRIRRKRKHSPQQSMTFVHALKARAIRERKIHLVGTPQLKLQPNVIFLDVEGIPDHAVCMTWIFKN